MSSDDENRWIGHLRQLAARQDDEEDRVTFPRGWTEDDIETLLEALEDGPILIDVQGLGIPTIHDFDDAKHEGYGLFRVERDDWSIKFDTGDALKRTPSGSAGWTYVHIIKGRDCYYDRYPFEKVRATLYELLHCIRHIGLRGGDAAEAGDEVEEDELGELAAQTARDDEESRVTFPRGWTEDDIETLLEALEDGPILIDVQGLGIPTIHDFDDAKHEGHGLVRVERADWSIKFDTGDALKRTPSGSVGWTYVHVIKGRDCCYGHYPFDRVRATLRAFLEMRDEGDEVGEDELETLAARAAEIRERKGEPCTVVAAAREGKITQVITPAWLYRQWHLYQKYIHEAIPSDENRRAVYGAVARGLFLGGENADFGAEFRRFCRCVIQAALLGLDRAAWEEKFENGADTAFSPSWTNWMPFIGPADEENPYLSWDVEQLSEELVQLDEEIGRINVKYGFEPSNMAPGNDAAREYYSLPPERHAAVDLLMMQSDLVVEAKQTKERKRVLEFGDNGQQVYFEGEKYMILNPYTEATKERCAGGWVWYYRDASTAREWRCLGVPDEPLSYIGALELSEAVERAEEVTGELFELVGRPDDLPESYPPPPWFSGDAEGASDIDRDDELFFTEGDRVWWEDGDEVLTGVVRRIGAGGIVVVKCDDSRAVGGGVPIGRVESVAAERLNAGPAPEELLISEDDASTSEPAGKPRQLSLGLGV